MLILTTWGFHMTIKNCQPSESTNGWSIILNNIAIFGTLLYIYIMYWSMLMRYAHFKMFNIIIFEFAEFQDYLFSFIWHYFSQGLSFPSIIDHWLPFLSPIILFLIGLKFLCKKWGKIIIVISLFAFIFVPNVWVYGVYFYKPSGASIYGIMEQSFRKVEVYLKENISVDLNGEKSNISLIGTTSKYMFFYNTTEDNAIVIPQSNIQAIKWKQALGAKQYHYRHQK